MTIEQFPVSPYAQVDPAYHAYSITEIKEHWPGVKIAGNVEHGCWSTKPRELSDYDPVEHSFFTRLVDILSRETRGSIADIGCGNGLGSIRGIVDVASRLLPTQLNIILSDIQAIALQEANENYKLLSSLPYSPSFIQLDIIEEDAAAKVMKMNDGNKVNGLICNWVLHFLTRNGINSLDQGIHTLNSLLEPGGLALIIANSIYNPACIGSHGKLDALERVHMLTNQGTSSEPAIFTVPDMNYARLNFFTQPSLTKRLEENGFRVLEIQGTGSTVFDNKQSVYYPVNYSALVTTN